MRKKISFIILSFLIPLFVYILVFFINGLFTNKSIIQGDVISQYYPLFHYLKGIFDGTNSLFYSFSKCLGGTMFGTIFYYMSSPLNLLMIFFSKKDISSFINFLVIFKLSLSGLTMYLYMRKKYDKDSFTILVFSLCYAFMGYSLNYFINVMWLDVVVLAPIVLLFLDRVIDDESPLFYILTLVVSIISNYYISYMLCLFCVLYFIYEVLLKYDYKKDKEFIKKISIKFIISSLFAGLICSVFLIPCILEALNYGRNVEVSKIFGIDLNFFNIFSKSYIDSISLNTLLNGDCINIYCGIIVLPLVFIYLTNRNFPKKERFLSLLMLFVLFSPCFIKVFNYIFHLFTIPMYYNYRYSFLLCFFLINIAFKSFENLCVNKKLLRLYFILYLIISLYLIIIVNNSNQYLFLNNVNIIVTVLILSVYLLLLVGIDKKSWMKKLLIFLMLFEVIINTVITFNEKEFGEIVVNKYGYIVDKNRGNKTIELYDDSSLYNNSLIYNYRGLNTFLSTNNIRMIRFLEQVGVNENKYFNSYLSLNESPIIETLLGVDKIISYDEDKYLKLYYNEIKDDIFIYENDNSFNIGYMISNDCNGIQFEFPYDEKVFNCITGTDNSFYKEVDSSDNGIYNLKKNVLYYVVSSNDDELVDKYIDDIIYLSYDYDIVYSDQDFVLELDQIDDLKVYYFDYKKYKNELSKIKMEQLESRIDNNKLYGKIDTSGGTLMITLPYEKGFKVFVDSEPVGYKEVLNTFIGIDLKDGIHEIVVEYEQPGFKIGILVSSISLIGLILYILYDKRNYNEE